MTNLLLGAVGNIDATVIRDALLYVVALVMAVTVHEFGHAFVADFLGDRLPRAQKRVTLNPVAHTDPIGTLLIPLIGQLMAAGGAAMPLLGWGRPVRVSLTAPRYRFGLSRRAADFFISIAGVTMNILFAVVLSVAFVVGVRLGGGPGYQEAVASIIMMNIGLFFFNLLPCPPLDGGRIVSAALGPSHPISEFLERRGYIIFLVVVFTPIIRFLMIPGAIITRMWIGQLLVWSGA